MDFELPFVHDCTFWCYHFGKISLTLLVLSYFFPFRINSKHYLILNYLTLQNRKKLIVTHFTFEIKFTFSKLPFNCYIHDKSTWQNPLLDTKCWLIYFAKNSCNEIIFLMFFLIKVVLDFYLLFHITTTGSHLNL